MSEMRGQPDAVPGTGDQDEVVRFLLELRAVGEIEPPEPSLEVARLIAGVPPVVRRHPYRRVAARAALVAAAVAAGLVVAAANHGLPEPAQRVVSNVVNVLTPFEIGPDAPVIGPGPHRTRHPAAPGTARPSEADRDEGPGGAESPTERQEPEESSAPNEPDEGMAPGDSEPTDPAETAVRNENSDQRGVSPSSPAAGSAGGGEREPGDT